MEPIEDVAATGYVTLAEGTIASDYALKNLNKALGMAQNEFDPAVKDEENTYGGYKYTPLVRIISAVRPALTKNHLTVSQFPSYDLTQKTVTIYTRIVHWDSGEWMQNTAELPAELALGKGGTAVFNQQTIGGSQTYAQKYAYKAIVGIPDSEEMIDSTEEKGDLPARQKAQRTTPATRPVQTLDPRQSPSEIPTVSKPAPEPVQQGVFFENKELGLLNCVILGVTEKETKGKKPYAAVNFNGRIDGFNWASNWHTSLTPALKDAIGKTVTIKLSRKKSEDGRSVQFLNIEGILEIDGVEFVKPTVTEELEHA